MSLINKIISVVSNQTNGIISSDNIYVVDYKNTNGGEVEVSGVKPSVGGVCLANPDNTEIYYAAFKDNALPEKKGTYTRQCECVLFPTTLAESDWILFIETKYAANIMFALNPSINYPDTMIEQVISTVNYFRTHNILPLDKRVHAIVSFPKLIEHYSEAFFTRSSRTREEILMNYKILLRATNEGEIISSKRIRI